LTNSTPSGLRIVFFGTPAFAAYILGYLYSAGENIVAVVTTPEKQQGRGLKTHPMVMQEQAQKLGISVLTPEKLLDEKFLNELRSCNADCFCVVAYKILPREVFTMPKYGTFNIHTSLLPKYRGAAPMNWAIMNGEKETGVTTFLLDKKVDTGNILMQASVPIGEDETVGDLHDTLMQLGATLALDTIRGLARGTLAPRSQADEEATPAPKIFPKDCIIDFSKSAQEVHNKIRGLSPHPGAVYLLRNGERVKIYRSRIVREIPMNLSPGERTTSADNKHLYIGTLTDTIEILELQREGRKRMNADEFLRGSMDFFG
jgi:methionyl-tRNA formyltransferase